MFLKNCWYCAGWDYEFSQAKDAIVPKRIAGELLVLYRKPDGGIVAMEDRCPHRQAALSLGRKEGESLRCMYHGMRFGPDGKCTEIPGQERIPELARVRTYPVIEKDNWVWVWMGNPDEAEPDLICNAVGPSDPNWNLHTAYTRIDANYRLALANLSDLSHAAFVHENTFGGTLAYATSKPEHEVTPRGLKSRLWMRDVPAAAMLQHLMPAGMHVDTLLEVEMTFPCNFILRTQIYTAGTAKDGPSDGHLISDTVSCQAVTPRDEHSVDYYYSLGTSMATDHPGTRELLGSMVDKAFVEDKIMMEAQYVRMKARPDLKVPTVAIVHDSGPSRILTLLDKLLAEESQKSS